MNYYFGNPQLFKMPRHFREPGPPLTPSPIARGAHSLGSDYIMEPGARLEVGPHGKLYESMGQVKESTLTKAIPYVAGGVILLVAYNMFLKS